MQYFNIEEKLEKTVNFLKEIKVIDKEKINVKISNGTKEKHVFGGDYDFLPYKEPYTVFNTETYYTFKSKFNVNENDKNVKTYLSIETFITGVQSTIRPQGLLYLNGQLTQGVDINHTDFLLKNGEYQMELLFYTHTFVRNLPLEFSIKKENCEITSIYYDFKVALESIKLLLQNTDDYINSIKIIDVALNKLDFRNIYSKEFYDSIAEAKKYLYDNYYVYRNNAPTVNCIGHTHIDVAWLWNLDQTKQKIERSFSTVLKLMEEYPEYKFMSSQPQLFAFLKETNLCLYEKIKEKVKEGRWEMDGAMWLEADCNLTSGESLVRQIFYGKKFLKEEFNVDSKTVWEPDVFGYSAQLPQIMKKSGVEKFVTAKIGWNDTNRMPYDSFIWQGIDGSKVFASLITTCKCDPRNGVYDETYTTYTAPINAEYVLGSWHRYGQKNYNDVTFMSYGYGDGGGGPTREMLEEQRRLNFGVLGIPKTKIATLNDTLQTIENNFTNSCKELKFTPKWNGELYFEYHRGTLTSVPKVKMNNRKGEFAIQNAEFISVLGNKLLNVNYPHRELENDWKILLLNQFHDILPGTSIKEVYQDSDKQFEQLFESVNNIKRMVFDNLKNNVKAKKGLLVMNFNGFLADGTINYNGKTVVVKDIPSFGYKVIEKIEEKPSTVFVEDKKIENDIYCVKFNDDGSIYSLLDKRFNREIVQENRNINEFVSYEDMPYQYDNWELTPYHVQKSYVLDKCATFEKIYDGDRAGYKIIKDYGNSKIEQKVFLYNGLDRIDFVTNVVWKENRQLLKVKMPFNLLIDKAVYDIQFGNLERSTSRNTSWDFARFESVANKWVDMSENNYGVALLNNGKYGFGAIDNELTLTVAKCGSFPFDGASDIIPEFTYSLLPHAYDYRDGNVIKNAYELNQEFTYGDICNINEGNLPKEFSFVNTNTRGIYIETIKQTDDKNGTIVRLFEAFKETKNVKINFTLPIQKAYSCNLLEENEKELIIDNNSIELLFKPFEIKTIKII